MIVLMGWWGISISNWNFIGWRPHLQAYLTLSHSTLLYFKLFLFKKIEGMTFHQHEDSNRFTTILTLLCGLEPWIQTHNISEICQYWVLSTVFWIWARHCSSHSVLREPCRKYSLDYLSNLDYISNYLIPHTK